MEFLLKLFSADFMPHVYCLRLPEVIWLYVAANTAIALAYFSIPPTLLLFIRKRRDIAFSWMFLLFGSFILACGATHVLDIVTLWHPIYRLDVVVRLVTGMASIATAVLLVRILPQALLLPNPQQLRDEIDKRTATQRELEHLNQVLEGRVLERTATLNASNAELETAVRELRYQLELNRAITTQAGDSILATDRDGNILFLNPQAQRTFGYTAEELLGRNLHELLHVDPLQANPRAVADSVLAISASKGLFLLDWSTEFFRKDGSAVQVACSASPVEVNGSCSGSVIIARDVTERVKAEKALKESELRYRTLVEAMPQMVWSAQNNGDADYFSRQWIQYTGKPDYQQFGSHWQSAVHPEDWEPTRQAWQSALVSQSDYQIEHRLRRHDGCWCWFKTRAVALRSDDGVTLRWLGTSTDIDADKRATEVLEQFNADLQNLASAMAHDLHEPLRAISTQTQMLARHVRDDLDDKGLEMIDRVIDSATHMRRLLQDISVYSETITRPLQVEQINLLELVQGVLRRVRAKTDTPEIGITFNIEPDCLVEADPQSLRLIFHQLFDNAVAYRRPGIALEIDVSAQLLQSEIVLAFADNGVGIQPEYHERIFQLFKRLHKQHEQPGSGIGLAMCQKILHRHGKKIWVRSRRGEGAVFYFSLQAASRALREEAFLHAPAAG